MGYGRLYWGRYPSVLDWLTSDKTRCLESYKLDNTNSIITIMQC